jgi:group I intron endonuclease
MNYTGSNFSLSARKAYRSIFLRNVRTGTCTVKPNPMYVGPVICTYAIHNDQTGQAYVGSTEDFNRRWSKHVADLKRGTHINTLLQDAYDKHGIEAFTLKILGHYQTTEGLLKAEATDAYANYKAEDLYNGRIGALYSPHYPFGYLKRNRKPTKNPGSQAKTRWYDGETTL